MSTSRKPMLRWVIRYDDPCGPPTWHLIRCCRGEPTMATIRRDADRRFWQVLDKHGNPWASTRFLYVAKDTAEAMVKPRRRKIRNRDSS